MKKGFLAYNLTEESSKKLLKKFPPIFSQIQAHHVTYKFGVTEDEKIPEAKKVEVIGYLRNSDIECVIVKVKETTQRPDNLFYHITISHTFKVKPSASNQMIIDGLIKKDVNPNPFWEEIEPFWLDVVPAFNPFGNK